MSDEALGVYVRLLCHAWLEGSIPDDPTRLCRMLKKNRRRFDALWPSIAPCWAPSTEGSSCSNRLINPRLEIERRKQQAFNTKQSERATSGYKSNDSNKTAEPRHSREAIPAEPDASREAASLFSVPSSLQQTNDRQVRSRTTSHRARKAAAPPRQRATHRSASQPDVVPGPPTADLEVPDVFDPDSREPSAADDRPSSAQSAAAPPMAIEPRGVPVPIPRTAPANVSRETSARGVDSARDFLPNRDADVVPGSAAARRLVANQLAGILTDEHPLIGDRAQLEAELVSLTREQAAIEGHTHAEALAEATSFDGQTRRGPLDPRKLTPERLLNSVLDARVNLEAARQAAVKRGRE